MSLTEQQHEERLTGIGASDAAVCMGLSKWKTRVELYLEKVQEVEPEDLSDNNLIYWGTKLEAMIAEGWSDKSGIKVRRVNETLRHPEHDFMICHLDRRQVGNGRVLECKNINQFYGAQAFGEEGTDTVPDPYLIQVHHQIEIGRAKWGCEGGELAGLIGGNMLKSFSFEHDPELAALIISREAEFWDHVVRRVPPPPISLGDLDVLFAEDNGEIKEVSDPEIVIRWEKLHDMKADLKASTAELEAEELSLKLVIAEAAGIKMSNVLEGPERPGISYAGKTLATWKTQGRKGGVDMKRLVVDHPRIAGMINASYIKPDSRFRVLRLTKKV